MSDDDEILEVDFETVKAGIADGSILLVDVRESNEFEEGHIPGSVSFPLSRFDPAQLPEPKDGQHLIFSCRTGGRTLRAIDMCQEAGVAYQTHYKGSFTDWVRRGGEVESA
jgi:rhodanese-related sulfurtransferase